MLFGCPFFFENFYQNFDWQNGLSLYRQAISNGDYYLAYGNLGSLMLQNEPLEKTIEFLKSTLEKLPLNASLRKALVIAYVRDNEYDLALIEVQKLLKLDPSQESWQLYQAVLRKEEL